jgi:hypothetical protein
MKYDINYMHFVLCVLIASIRLLFTAPTSLDPYATCDIVFGAPILQVLVLCV